MDGRAHACGRVCDLQLHRREEKLLLVFSPVRVDRAHLDHPFPVDVEEVRSKEEPCGVVVDVYILRAGVVRELDPAEDVLRIHTQLQGLVGRDVVR